jgi:hypothetical protein
MAAGLDVKGLDLVTFAGDLIATKSAFPKHRQVQSA